MRKVATLSRCSFLVIGLWLFSGCSYFNLGAEPKAASTKTSKDASKESKKGTSKSKTLKRKKYLCAKDKVWKGSKLAKLAKKTFITKDYQEAERCLSLFVKTFPKDSRTTKFIFQQGVVQSKLGKYKKAVATFKKMLTLAPLHARAPDARLELGASLFELKRIEEAEKQINAVVKSTNLDSYLIVRALVVKARIHTHKKQYHIAEDHLWRAFHRYHRSDRRGEYVDAHLMGSIRYYFARIKHSVMKETQPITPRDSSPAERERSFKSLETRTKWLIESQYGYLRVIRGGEAYWAIQAGNQIGFLYEDLFQHLASLPIPSDFTKEEALLYRKELNARLDVLLKKAVVDFRKVYATADRVRTSNAWVEQTTKSLRRVQNLVETKTKVKAEGKAKPSPNG